MAMDIAKYVEQVVEKVTKDGAILEKFKKDPVKTVADLLGISQSYISRLEKRIMLRLRREISRQFSA